MSNIIGQKFERLEVLSKSYRNKNSIQYYECKCDCGNIINTRKYCLISGSTKSCGCLHKEKVSTHNITKTRFYRIWQNIKTRCLNKNHTYYKNYGERGINICDRWLNFDKFKEDMYDSYLEYVKDFGEKDTSIDRENNNLGYSKDNCKWSTCEEQASNRREINWDKAKFKNQKLFKAISPEGIEYIEINQRKFAREYELDSNRVNSCLNNHQKTHNNWKFKYLSDDEINNFLVLKQDEV